MAEVSLANVSKVYPGGVQAVRDLSLAVADGEFVVLVGPSGCGKSSTLRMVAGLEEVTRGTIRIDGRIVNDLHPKDRDVAMVFQNYALYPHMTVYRNMAFALRLRKTPKAEIDRRVREAARILGIEGLLDRRPGALSGGQRQRVAVGRAIVRNPRCFLFDEPLSNLDVRLRILMRAEIKALHLRLKTTTIYVTHDQEEAMTLGDRIAVMSDGLIQQVAPPLEVYRRPLNRFVAGFVGMPPMNFIDGRLESRDGAAVFTDGAGLVTAAPAPMAGAPGPPARPVTMGVRPECLAPLGEGAAASQGTIAVDVRVVEPLGDRLDIHGCTPGGSPMIARVDSSIRAAPGERMLFRAQPGGVHFFERGEYGARLGGLNG
jgi:multiple sugar transport system ATP-binding protein